ncbi:MAG: hypothetical protein ACRBC3_06520 [Burkholderiaceae bacterium]
MNQLISWLLVASGLILGVAGSSYAQNRTAMIDFAQLTAEEREQLRSQLKNREVRAGRLSADVISATPVGSGLTAPERQALRALLRAVDSRLDLSPTPAANRDVNIEALKDSSQISEPIASNEPFTETRTEPNGAWPFYDSIPSHTGHVNN